MTGKCLPSCSFWFCSSAAAHSWLAPRSVGCSVLSSIWCPERPQSSLWQVPALSIYTQHCPWVCACSSRVILLTLHIMGGDIYLPFENVLFLGKEPGFPAGCNQEDHCPVNKITFGLLLNGLFKGTLRLRVSTLPCRVQAPGECSPGTSCSLGHVGYSVVWSKSDDLLLLTLIGPDEVRNQ